MYTKCSEATRRLSTLQVNHVMCSSSPSPSLHVLNEKKCRNEKSKMLNEY